MHHILEVFYSKVSVLPRSSSESSPIAPYSEDSRVPLCSYAHLETPMKPHRWIGPTDINTPCLYLHIFKSTFQITCLDLLR